VKITIEPTTDQSNDDDPEGRYPEVSACWRERDDLDTDEVLMLVKTAMEAYGFVIPGLKVTDD
jgi:hypothetical protein